MLCARHCVQNSNIPNNLCSSHFCHPHFTDEVTEVVCHSVHTLNPVVSEVRLSQVQIPALPLANCGCWARPLITLSLVLLISKMGVIIVPPWVVSTVSISEQALIISECWMPSTLRHAHFNISGIDQNVSSTNGISQAPWTVAVVTRLSLPTHEQTWSKLFISLSLPCLSKYQIALSIRIKIG